MAIKIFNKGFNYSQDGPGNRLVYHLQGCNMKCPWCSNPEGLSNDLLKSRDNTLDITSIIEEVERSQMMFFDGGGVTLSGGEPTNQFHEIKELLIKLKALDITTAIETNGTHKELLTLFPLIDTLIMDFKHFDDLVHRSVTGISNKIIKENIEKALQSHKNIWIRTPLIKGFNASESDLEGFVNFFKKKDTTSARFEFLKYHEYGKVKWEQCHMDYKIKDGSITQETLELFEKSFRKNGLKVVRT